MDYKSFYKLLTGFAPYDYQIRVAERLLSGKNIILSVPTGAGKTWASIIPFLYAKQRAIRDFPQKLIYSLPLRTLANSIYSDVFSVLNSKNFNVNLSIQTGEYKDDRYFEEDIVFSTIDQTLSNFLCFPLALSQRQANINAGALIGSYLAFDEFHLLDPNLSMATSLGMLRILSNLCRVCIMTATLTADYIQFIKKNFGFEVVTIEDFPEDKAKISSLKPKEGKNVKKNIIVYTDKKLNADSILKTHKNKTIVICNRVETAQNIFSALQDKKGGTEICCIHSRFYDSDRKKNEAEIKKYFGKNSKYKDVILIATQVIEAGMDISCDTMHTEISPINSFLQRIGRCARFENEYGEIYVYDVLDLEEKEKVKIEPVDEEDKKEIRKLNNKYLPYDKEVCEKSLIELKKYSFIDERIAEELVNTVLKEREIKVVNSISANLFNIEKIKESWRDCDKKHYRETIRDIQSVEIALIDLENCQNQKIFPWQYETISVYKWSFISWIKILEDEKLDADDWIIAKAIQSGESSFDFEWQENDAWFLKRLNALDLKNHFDIVFVDNRYFDYSEAGLTVRINENNKKSPYKQKAEKEKLKIIFRKDTFYEHNKALLNCYETVFKPKCDFLFSELDKYWGEKTDWDKLIKTAICFHDYGKLNETWQIPMREFQKKRSGVDNSTEILAHTDYDETIDKELAKECKINGKPPHAGIGAMQVWEILCDKSEKLADIVACAVLKHHGIDTKSFVDFKISRLGIKEMEKILAENQIEYNQLISQEKGEPLADISLKEKEYIVYLFITRILRLCDQKATESIEKYI